MRHFTESTSLVTTKVGCLGGAMLSLYNRSSIFIFNSSKVGWGSTLEEALSAKSHGEEDARFPHNKEIAV